VGAPDLATRYRVEPASFRLADRDPGDTAGLDRHRDQELTAADLEQLRRLQQRLYAEQRRALLVVLQGMDAAGKDGTIAHVMGGAHPQGVRVASFRQPNSAELAHDWLWRYAIALPERGKIGLFNRSHYEEVVVVRVHPDLLGAQALDPAAADERFWRDRHRVIAAWEQHLVSSGTSVVKFFLHLSKHEQRRRLLARFEDPEKRWKFVPEDVEERTRWDAYHAAYEAALRATSSDSCPWYAIPADHKWLARTAVARILVQHLEAMDPRFPELDEDRLRAAEQAVAMLMAEDRGET
jgi:PPK2 family polyphosphate:nucleotide phosphotransferase